MRDVFQQSDSRGVADTGEDNRNGPGPLQKCLGCRPAPNNNNIGSEAHQLVGVCTQTMGIARTKVEPHVATFDPAQLRESLPQSVLLDLTDRVGFATARQYTDAPHAVALLPPRHYWPRRRAS
jgi:hypothetical protein